MISPVSPPDAISFQDDQVLEGTARQVVTDINHFFSKARLEQAGASDERARLARELHDGVLQSLTGAALQLEALARLMGEGPSEVRRRLREIEMLIIAEQRELRTWIHDLQPSKPTSMASRSDLFEALRKPCEQIQQQWQLNVRLAISERAKLPRPMGDEIYRLVQEGLSNAARHAHAQYASVELDVVNNQALVIIADDGRGFAFRGRFDLSMLTARRLGPDSIKQRVASLHGDLLLSSTSSGSRLEIRLPLIAPALSGDRALRRT